MSQNGKDLSQLEKFASLTYNPAGFLPSTAVFRLTLAQLKPVVLQCVKDFLSDAVNVTFITNGKTGEVATFVWIPSDSKHLRDESTLNERSAIKVPLTRYSSDLKEFMERFCYNDNKRVISEENGMHLAGIQIDLARIMKILFDERGNTFNKTFGGPRVQTNIKLIPNYEKGRDGQNFGRLLYLEIRKSTKSGLEETEPHPKRSFKA